MTDKLYNGFNNGRDKSDGVGGREVNHGTQQTMTKEQILWNVLNRDLGNLKDDFINYEHFLEESKKENGTAFITAMEEYAQQEVAKEREKAKKLIGALNVNAHQWKSTRFEQGKILREKIKQSLTEYKSK